MITFSGPLTQHFCSYKVAALQGRPRLAVNCSNETGSGVLEIKCRIYCTHRDICSLAGNKTAAILHNAITHTTAHRRFLRYRKIVVSLLACTYMIALQRPVVSTCTVRFNTETPALCLHVPYRS